jgi:hypothetical protein
MELSELGNCFFTHRMKLKELLELNIKTKYDFKVLLIFETTIFFMFSILISTFKTTNFDMIQFCVKINVWIGCLYLLCFGFLIIKLYSDHKFCFKKEIEFK